jgi:hypothetical protein
MCHRSRDSKAAEASEAHMMSEYEQPLFDLFGHSRGQDVFLVLFSGQFRTILSRGSRPQILKEFEPQLQQLAAAVQSTEATIHHTIERGGPETRDNITSFRLNCHSSRIFVTLFPGPVETHRLVILNRTCGDDRVIEDEAFGNNVKQICNRMRRAFDGLAGPHVA